MLGISLIIVHSLFFLRKIIVPSQMADLLHCVCQRARGEASHKCHRGLHVYAPGSSISITVEFYRILKFYRGLMTPMLMGSSATGLRVDPVGLIFC